MILEIIIFVLGLAFLVKGADIFVKAASSIARRLGVSEFVIGLTVVAVGTSVPELANAVTASLVKDSGLVMGNIIGANIANIGLIMGSVALVFTLKTKKTILHRDGYFMLFAVFLFYLFILDMNISRVDALIFLFFYVIYILFLAEKRPDKHIRDFVKYFFGFQYLATIKSRVFYYNHEKKIKQKKKIKRIWEWGLAKDFLILAAGCAAVIMGANIVVKEAEFFADLLGVPTNIIGISIIALGTTLPELTVTLRAAKKGFSDVALGNIIGSVIANVLFIIGVAGLIHPLGIIKSTMYFTAPFMILMCLIFLIFLKTEWNIRRWEGVALVSLYVIFMVLLFTGVIY